MMFLNLFMDVEWESISRRQIIYTFITIVNYIIPTGAISNDRRSFPSKKNLSDAMDQLNYRFYIKDIFENAYPVYD